MQVGELFVNLGIKGADKTVAALGSVKQSLGNVSSMSIEAKAGIIGAMYALERLTAASGAMGTSLTNFTALTGLSAKSLQEWQYAARQAGVSGDEMSGSMKGVQSAMANMLMGKGAPEGLGLIASKVGFDMSRARDTAYVLGQYQEFAQSVPADIGNTALKSTGLSEGVISAMRRNAFRPDVFAKAPTYSDREIGALDKANIAWSNLGNKIEMAIGHFNSRHGGQLVKDISMITDKVIKLAESFTTLAEKLKVFQLIGKVFEGWGIIFDGLNSALKNASTSKPGDKPSFMNEFFKEFQKDINLIVEPSVGNHPNLGSKQNVQINQNLHFQHDGKDAGKIKDSHRKSAQDAFRQMPAQVGGY